MHCNENFKSVKWHDWKSKDKSVYQIKKNHVLKHSHEINFPACSVTLCISLKIIGFSNVLVEINKIPNNSKKDESTNNNTTMFQEEVISFDKKHNAITRKGTSSFKGELCSLHGLQFSVWIISMYEIDFFACFISTTNAIWLKIVIKLKRTIDYADFCYVGGLILMFLLNHREIKSNWITKLLRWENQDSLSRRKLKFHRVQIKVAFPLHEYFINLFLQK